MNMCDIRNHENHVVLTQNNFETALKIILITQKFSLNTINTYSSKIHCHWMKNINSYTHFTLKYRHIEKTAILIVK